MNLLENPQIQWLHDNDWSHAAIALVVSVPSIFLGITSYASIATIFFYYGREVAQAKDEFRPWRWKESSQKDFYRPLAVSIATLAISYAL